MLFIRKNWLFFVLLLLGLVVRVLFMVEQGFSNDELSALCRTRFDSLSLLVKEGVKNGDMHPAFYQVLLWFWVKIFGENEFMFRALSLVFYIANSWLIYRISCRYFNRETGILLTALYAGLTFMIINTVFARPYNSGTFFLLLAVLFVLDLRFQNSKWKYALLLSMALLGAMLSHYFAFLVAFVIGISALFYVGKKNVKYVLIAGILATVGFLPHLQITLFQLDKGGLQWLAAPGWTWIPDFTRQFLNDSWLVGILLIATYLLLFTFKGRYKISREAFFLGSIFLVSFGGAFVISHVYTPILREVVMLFILPFILIPILHQLDLKRGIYFNVFVIVFVLGIAGDSILRNQLLEPDQFGVFKEIGGEINRSDKDFGRQNITHASNYNSVDYINYYVDNDLREDIIDWTNQQTIQKVHERAIHSTTPYFCYSFNNVYHTPLYLEVIRRHYPGLERNFLTKFSTFYLFTKKKERQLPQHFASVETTDSIETTQDFFGSIRLKVKDLPKGKGFKNYFLVKCKGMLTEAKPLYLVVALERDGKMAMNKDDQPIFYSAFDQSIIHKPGEAGEFILAFDMPQNARDEDELSILFWNPEKAKVRTGKMYIYLVQ